MFNKYQWVIFVWPRKSWIKIERMWVILTFDSIFMVLIIFLVGNLVYGRVLYTHREEGFFKHQDWSREAHHQKRLSPEQTEQHTLNTCGHNQLWHTNEPFSLLTCTHKTELLNREVGHVHYLEFKLNNLKYLSESLIVCIMITYNWLQTFTVI